MEIIEIQEKIKEWETDLNHCGSPTVQGLIQKTIDAGNDVKDDLICLSEVYSKNNESYRKCLESLKKVLDTGDMDEYLSLFSTTDKQEIETICNELEKEVVGLEESQKVKDFVEFMQSRPIQELNEELDAVLNRVEYNNEFLELVFIVGIIKKIATILTLNQIDEVLFEQCAPFVDEAFNYHDYGQWDNIKKAGIDLIMSKILGISCLAELTKSFADLARLFDESAAKKEFYRTTEANILKMEEQIKALKFTDEYIKWLIQFYKVDKYNFNTD